MRCCCFSALQYCPAPDCACACIHRTAASIVQLVLNLVLDLVLGAFRVFLSRGSAIFTCTWLAGLLYATATSLNVPSLAYCWLLIDEAPLRSAGTAGAFERPHEPPAIELSLSVVGSSFCWRLPLRTIANGHNIRNEVGPFQPYFIIYLSCNRRNLSIFNPTEPKMSASNLPGNRNSTPETSNTLRPPSARSIGAGHHLRASADMAAFSGTPLAGRGIRPSSEVYYNQANGGQGQGNTDEMDKTTQQWLADIDQYEATLEEMATATLDQDFKDELSAIEQWFRVLSEAERTSALYALIQQTTQVQIRFFIQVLQEMAKNHPMSGILSPANFGQKGRSPLHPLLLTLIDQNRSNVTKVQRRNEQARR